MFFGIGLLLTKNMYTIRGAMRNLTESTTPKIATTHEVAINTARVVTPYVLPSTGFIRLNQILLLIPLSRSTWLAGVTEGRYPKSVHLSKRTVAWKVQDIRMLIEQLGGGNE